MDFYLVDRVVLSLLFACFVLPVPLMLDRDDSVRVVLALIVDVIFLINFEIFVSVQGVNHFVLALEVLELSFAVWKLSQS